MSGEVGGLLQQFWAQTEGSSYDTHSAFVATDAVDLIDLTFDPELNFEELNEHTGSGSLQTEVQQNEGGAWGATAYVRPAAAGTAPDVGEMLKAAYGTETVGGSDVTYSFSDGSVLGTSVHSLQLGKYSTDELYEQINGASVEQIVIELLQNQTTKLSFSGRFATYGFVYANATVNGVHSTSDPSIELNTGEAAKLRPNCLIAFGAEDNGGAGYLLTAIDYTNDVVTISPGLAGGLSGGEVVAPVVPSQTLGGTPQGGVANELTVDSSDLGLISYKLTISTGIELLNQESSSAKPTGIFRKKQRALDGEIVAYYKDATTHLPGGAWNGTLRNIIARAGPNTAAQRMKVNTPNARIGVAGLPLSDSEAATFTLPFKPHQNAAAGDEHTLVFD